jgi:hypothetical protein
VIRTKSIERRSEARQLIVILSLIFIFHMLLKMFSVPQNIDGILPFGFLSMVNYVWIILVIFPDV